MPMPGITLKGAPLSFQQERLWSFQQANTTYQMWCTITMDGRLNFQALEQALQQIVEQHTIFQTLFYTLPGMDIPAQVIGHDIDFRSPVINLEHIALPAQNVLLETLLLAFQEQPFDLKHGPLFRPTVFRLATERALLLICLPALYADAPTLPLLIKDFTQRYTAILLGQEIVEEPLQYTTISAWQRQQRIEDSEGIKAAHEFWQKVNWLQIPQMQRYLEQIGMMQRNISSTTYCKPATFPIFADDILSAAQSNKLASRYKVPVPVILLAGWLVLLRHITAESRIVIGVARNGRNYEDLTDALGLHTRFVPFDLTLQDNWSFAQLLSFIEPLLAETEEYQHYFSWPPMLHEQHQADIPDFFPISFEHEEWPASFEATELNVQFNQRLCWTEPFFLKLDILQVGERFQIALRYDTQKVSGHWVSQLATMLQTLLRSLVEQPQKQIGTFSLLSTQQRTHLLTTFSGTQRSWPAQSLHQLFEAQAQRQPGALAVISDQEQLTYQQLNVRANQLAQILRRQGVDSNRLVGLCLARQASMLVGLLAILKAGGAYLPLDTNNPAQRLQYQLQESGATLLLTQEAQRGSLPEWAGKTLYLEDLTEELALAAPDNLHVQSLPEHLAYVIYTSGSTGAPKGVMISQRNVVNYTLALCEQLGVEPGWQYATVSTLAADLGNTAIFCSLASGGCVQVLTYETVTSSDAMATWAEQHPIDVLKIVPSHLSSLLESTRARVFLPHRALVLGGEALSEQLVAQVQQMGGTCQIYNHYGPTETTIGVLVNAIGTPNGEEQEKIKPDSTIVALGRPIANTNVYVLDPHLQLVPPGVMGELYIGGAGVALGYIEQAAQTAERFVPHPFSKLGGERLYRTGDLARYSQQAQIEFIGRLDGQVKMRGYRIEVGEIEAALRQHPQIRDCVIALQTDTPRHPQLVGYIVPKKLPLQTDLHIRDFLQELLPDYMIPSVFIYMKFLPLTANGKVDRHQLTTSNAEGRHNLPALIDTSSALRTIIQPRDVLEMHLLQIWEAVLQLQPISIVDNFFDIGGHSLLAVQLISHIAERFGRNLDLATLFRHPTVAELAIVLRQQKSSGEEPLLAAIQPKGSRPPFFCVHPAGGTAFCYIHLARYLGSDQPFYGLHAPLGTSIGEKNKPVGDTIEEMATLYIAAIQAVQPQGPYLLGGWSLGGVIAFEMAQQLQMQGHEVRMLAIFDSTISSPQERDDAMATVLDLSDASVVKEFTQTAEILVPDDFEQRTIDEQLNYAVEQAKKMHTIPADASLDLVRIYTRVRIMTKQIVHTYIGRDYPRKIDYFLSSPPIKQEAFDDAEDRAESSIKPQRLQRWRELTKGNIEVHNVPGSHDNMLEEPHVQTLAKALKQCIDNICEAACVDIQE